MESGVRMRLEFIDAMAVDRVARRVEIVRLTKLEFVVEISSWLL